jgi:TPR repeat protein
MKCHRPSTYAIIELAEAGDADAQFHLAYMHHLGRGMEQDVGAAEIWYLRAAAQGHELAQLNLRAIAPFYRR